MKKSIDDLVIIILLIVSVSVLSLFIFEHLKFFVSKKTETEKSFITSTQNINYINILFITDGKVPSEFNKVISLLHLDGYNVLLDRIPNFDKKKIEKADVVICDKTPKTQYQKEILINLLKSSKKIIVTKNCRSGDLDELIGIQYNGMITMKKGKKYKIEYRTSILFTKPEVVPYYVPLYTYTIMNMTCLYNSWIVRFPDLNSDVICYDRYRKLVLSYSLYDFFNDKFYYGENIIEKFIIS